MSYTLERVSSHYALDITESEMIDLLEYEWDRESEYGQSLVQRLIEETPVYDVEYDGHFGAVIYYTLHVTDDCDNMHDKIKEIVKEQLLRAAAWKDTK